MEKMEEMMCNINNLLIYIKHLHFAHFVRRYLTQVATSHTNYSTFPVSYACLEPNDALCVI